MTRATAFAKIDLKHATALTEGQFNGLNGLARLYYREARRCERSKAYLASCVMIGATLEAALVCMVHLYPDDVFRKAATLVPRAKGKPRSLLEWPLRSLIRIAAKCGWLPAALSSRQEFDHRKATVGDYADLVRKIRNLVHAARYVQDRHNKRIGKRELEWLFEIHEAVKAHLRQRVDPSLLAAIKRFESRQRRAETG